MTESMLTEEERARRAAENDRITAQTHKLAAEARERDRLNGQLPVTTEVANNLKKRLELSADPNYVPPVTPAPNRAEYSEGNN